MRASYLPEYVSSEKLAHTLGTDRHSERVCWTSIILRGGIEMPARKLARLGRAGGAGRAAGGGRSR
jgi:hypothetical protein